MLCDAAKQGCYVVNVLMLTFSRGSTVLEMLKHKIMRHLIKNVSDSMNF